TVTAACADRPAGAAREARGPRAKRRQLGGLMLTRAHTRSMGRTARRATVLGVLLVLLAGARPLARPASARQPDISYIWRDGARRADGATPYAFDRTPEEERPTKHPSYLPLFYLAVAGVYKLGVHDYGTWLVLWRAVRIVAHIVITV